MKMTTNRRWCTEIKRFQMRLTTYEAPWTATDASGLK
jgi:hypothetical protein